MLNITYLRELCEKATPGPWRKLMVLSGKQDFFLLQADGCSNILKREDADFAITAREALPELLDRVEALEWLVEVLLFPPVDYSNLRSAVAYKRNGAPELAEIEAAALRDAGMEG